MPSNLILDLFYNEIIIEAQVGRIDAFFMMNLIFEVSINNKQITKTSVGYEDVIIRNCVGDIGTFFTEEEWNNIGYELAEGGSYYRTKK